MAQNRTTGLWARIKGLFAERPFEPGDWRPASKIELLSMGSSPTSRQYVRVGEDDFSPLTRRLSRTKYIELSQGAPPVKLARERKEAAARGERVSYPSGERGRRSAEATHARATRKRLYPGETYKDILRFKELQAKKRAYDAANRHLAANKLRHPTVEHKFLHEDFTSPKTTRKDAGYRARRRAQARRAVNRVGPAGQRVRTARRH